MKFEPFKKIRRSTATSSFKREVYKKSNSFYSDKGIGLAKDSERLIKNKIYQKTSFDSLKKLKSKNYDDIDENYIEETYDDGFLTSLDKNENHYTDSYNEIRDEVYLYDFYRNKKIDSNIKYNNSKNFYYSNILEMKKFPKKSYFYEEELSSIREYKDIKLPFSSIIVATIFFTIISGLIFGANVATYTFLIIFFLLIIYNLIFFIVTIFKPELQITDKIKTKLEDFQIENVNKKFCYLIFMHNKYAKAMNVKDLDCFFTNLKDANEYLNYSEKIKKLYHIPDNNLDNIINNFSDYKNKLFDNSITLYTKEKLLKYSDEMDKKDIEYIKNK